MKPYIAYKLGRLQNSLHNEGPVRTLRKAVLAGIFKPVNNHLHYLLKRKIYPHNIIFIAGFAKSGTTWLANILSSLGGFDRFEPIKWDRSPVAWNDTGYDLYPGIFDEFKHKLAVIKGHTWGKRENIDILNRSGMKYIITMRDPRDTIISAYWYIRNYSRNHWDHRLACSMSLSEYISYKLESGEYEEQYIEWMRMWIRNRDEDKSTLLKYEYLVEDTDVIIENTVRFLGMHISEMELRKIMESNSFEKMAGRRRGVEDTTSFFRKGITKEWRNIFTDYQRKYFAKVGEDIIEELGYESTM